MKIGPVQPEPAAPGVGHGVVGRRVDGHCVDGLRVDGHCVDGHWADESVWTGTRAPLRAATGLPPEMYTDEGFFAAERSRLFERSWVAVGSAAEAAEAGRLLVRRVGGRSILVTRDE